MAFTSEGARVWPVPPDWSEGIEETLTWSTDVLRATATAVTQHRGLQLAPRRSFTFSLLTDGQERRTADMLLAGHGGEWELPIWTDVVWLAEDLEGGAEEIPCDPVGRDFVEGGKALLWSSVNRWELVTIDSIDTDHIALTTPTDIGYVAGSRLYPLRRARVQDGAEETLLSDALGQRSITFDIAEPCDWPALDSPPEYLGHPVLDVRPAESEDPTNSYNRLVQAVDYGTSLPAMHDLPAVALRAQRSHWMLYQIADHSWFRSLLYTLCGRRVPMWVPSWTADLRAANAIAGDSTTLTIEWAGYTLFGLDQTGRQDIRIELTSGTVYHRRITAAIEAGDTETLTLNASLASSSIAAARIRVISFMALCTLASDSIDIQHDTDIEGTATAKTGWQGVVSDV